MIQIVLLVVLAPLAGWLPQRRSTNALMGVQDSATEASVRPVLEVCSLQQDA